MSEPIDRDQLRAELRRIWRRAGRVRWNAARVAQSSEVRLYAESGAGELWLLATPNRLEDAQLAAASKNALPVLFAEIDRRTADVPMLGDAGRASG